MTTETTTSVAIPENPNKDAARILRGVELLRERTAGRPGRRYGRPREQQDGTAEGSGSARVAAGYGGGS